MPFDVAFWAMGGDSGNMWQIGIFPRIGIFQPPSSALVEAFAFDVGGEIDARFLSCVACR